MWKNIRSCNRYVYTYVYVGLRMIEHKTTDRIQHSK